MELVDLSLLDTERSVLPKGAGGADNDPRDSTADHGEDCLKASMELLHAVLVDRGVISS